MARFSKYKARFFIDPVFERQACAYINSLGNQYILEGASGIGSGDLRIWWRDIVTDEMDCKIIPIIANFDGDYPPAPVKLTPEIQEQEDLAVDNTFLIEKK